MTITSITFNIPPILSWIRNDGGMTIYHALILAHMVLATQQFWKVIMSKVSSICQHLGLASESSSRVTTNELQMAVCQNLVPLVNIKIAGKWMFIPLKMVLIGIDPYPNGHVSTNKTIHCCGKSWIFCSWAPTFWSIQHVSTPSLFESDGETQLVSTCHILLGENSTFFEADPLSTCPRFFFCRRIWRWLERSLMREGSWWITFFPRLGPGPGRR